MAECSCPTFTLHGSSTDIYFPMPEYGVPENAISKNITLFNFWEGDRDTVDTGINAQPLLIGGTVCNNCGPWGNGLCFPICFPACFNDMSWWLTAIETAMNNGEEFEIDELGDCLDGVYVIRNFTFASIKKSPNCYEWSLDLERVRDLS